MPELIDRHALLEKVYEHPLERERMTDGEWCRKCIYEAPKVEAEPVQHGNWLSYTGTHWTGKVNDYGDPEYKEHIFYVCSNCRRKTVVRENFCPRCGWYMRETDTAVGGKGSAENG